jgi:glycosyltransferase involved in cell wall biosynthesis
MRKIVVVHFGKQHVFRLLKALDLEKAYNLKFITTSYYKPFSVYWLLDKFSLGIFHRRLSKIKIHDFSDNNIILFNQTLSFILAILVRIDTNKRFYGFVYKIVYKRFVTKVVAKISILNPDLVIYYDPNYLAKELKLLNPNIILIYDVAMASYRMTKEIENIDKQKYPNYGTLFVDEDRFLSSIDIDVIDSGVFATDFFIVGSDFVRESLKFYNIENNKIFIVNYGSDLNHDFHLANKPFTRPYKLVFIGRAVQRKGIGHFLETIRSYEFKKLISPIIIGDSKLLQKSNLFDLTNIKLTGHIEKKDLSFLLREATFLFMPTLIEGMSLAILEAMSHGAIPITTKNSGYSSIIVDGHNGFMIDPYNYKSVHKILTKVIKDETLMRDLSYNAILSAKALSWEKYTSGIQDTVRSILMIQNNEAEIK